MMKLIVLLLSVLTGFVVSKHIISVGHDENWETSASGDKFDECTDDSATTGWATNSYGNEIAAQCCSDDGTTGRRQDLPGGIDYNGFTGCLKGVSYSVAKAACESITGYRLCTAKEVRDNIGSGSGCNHDARHVWTSDECSAHKIVVGNQPNVGDKPEECADDDAIRGTGYNSYGNEIGAQCCSQDGTQGYRQNLPGGIDYDGYTGCLRGVTFSEAKAGCESAGYRLCTAQEVTNHVGQGSGCQFDAHHVWSSDICDNTAHSIIIGAQTNVAGKPEECAANTATSGVASNAYGDEIGVQCCDMDGTSGSRQNLPGGSDFNGGTDCIKAVSYDSAKRTCRAIGKRLCSIEEVEADVGKGSGCYHDHRHVWTADTCQYRDHQLVVGNQVNSGSKPAECANNGEVIDSDGDEIGVQCCHLDGSDGFRQNLDGGEDFNGFNDCYLGVTYAFAKAICEGEGARLCTAQEVINGVGQGSGCNHDSRRVWTADSCERDGVDCCAKRCRREWSTLAQPERDLYINGFKQLADSGDIQLISKSHNDLFNNRIHGTELFLPWHRAYLYDLESAIRALGAEYECFGLPYWDWSNEPTPTEVNGGSTLVIMNSGLGNDPNGGCINDGSPFSDGQYDPQSGSCLIRDLDYPSDRISCRFSTPSSLIDRIDATTVYASFRSNIEGTPHVRPHVCIRGQMSGGNSPDDPIFFLHHNFVDYIWAVWQDCNDYDGVTTTIGSDEYSGDPSETLSLPHNPSANWVAEDVIDISDINVIYEKGPFWDNANVDDADNCGLNSNPNNINDAWFYSDGSRRRRRLTESKDYAQEIYDELVKGGKYKNNHKELVHEWAELVCKHEQKVSGKICEAPQYFDDCSNMELNPYTNDIDITLDELLEKEGINECMKETRIEFYEWAVLNRVLYQLCSGCFDPFCQRRCKTVEDRNDAEFVQEPSIPYDDENKYDNKYDDNKNNKYYVFNISEGAVYWIIVGLVILLIILSIINIINGCNKNINKAKYVKIKYIESDSEFAYDSEANLK